MTAAVSIRDLSFAYEKDPVISHMDLTFPAGTITAVLGANGVGKPRCCTCCWGCLNQTPGRSVFRHAGPKPFFNPAQAAHRHGIPERHPAL